jgi:hypothetical protein
VIDLYIDQSALKSEFVIWKAEPVFFTSVILYKLIQYSSDEISKFVLGFTGIIHLSTGKYDGGI